VIPHADCYRADDNYRDTAARIHIKYWRPDVDGGIVTVIVSPIVMRFPPLSLNAHREKKTVPPS